VLAALNADHCVDPACHYPRRIDALRVAVAKLEGKPSSSVAAAPKDAAAVG
jgi:hypothetical protein